MKKPDENDGRRLDDLIRFYSILEAAEQTTSPIHLLGDCSGRMTWPRRGVYFFREEGEERSDTGAGMRIVRVGTHALILKSRVTLWRRLAQHRGNLRGGGGNHRASIFRLLVGNALINHQGASHPSWGRGSTAPTDVREAERGLECEVSRVLGAMFVQTIAIDDEPGPSSRRGYIERNAIALLSNCGKPALDPPSAEWLGRHCDREKVRASGLWNTNHVGETYDPSFLDELTDLARRT